MKKLLTLAAALGLALVASLAPRAEAAAYCSKTYCQGKPSSTVCGCPPGTDRVGAPSTCGSWDKVGGCWYE